jgi:hypothetical protein
MGHSGPLTAGEARALMGALTGIEDLTKVQAFVNIVITECDVCGSQKLITTTDLKRGEVITVLFGAISEIGTGDDHAHPGT